jgi:hypothetical protein
MADAGLGAGERLVLTRFAVLRVLGVVYTVAFLVLALQGLPLLGHDGLLPVDAFLARARSAGYGFWRLPTVFWLDASDALFQGLAWVGVALGALCALGVANAITLAVLWALYLSYVHVGQLFTGYGWDIQLCETGFLAIFLAPPLDLRPLAARAPPRVVVWLFRWLIVRIMLGAGLIKLRGDPCWRDLTCLDFHFETQPVPNPLSPLFHHARHAVHLIGVLLNHAAELGAPLLVFLTRWPRRVAGAIMLAFQLTLILSGNLAFLNWLTIVPILACFDDGVWRRVLPRAWVTRADAAPPTPRSATVVSAFLAVGVAFLSIDVVSNLVSSHQRMNGSFEPFELVNTYGAFGSVGRERDELVFEGTVDDPPDEHARWRAYEWRCKPGDLERRPCWISPYHLRLDWQVWFAAMESPDQAPWTVHMVAKLLRNDRALIGLLANDPFPDGPPRYIRARIFRYRFAPAGEPGWWRRDHEREWLPPLSLDDPALRSFLDAYGWH